MIGRWLARVRHPRCRIAVLAFLAAVLCAAPAGAARVAVVLSDESEPYLEVYQAIRAGLGETPHEVERAVAENLAPARLRDAAVVVTVGVRATEALARLGERPPLLAVLVPRSWYLSNGQALLAASNRPFTAIYLEQTSERQARLVREAFPTARTVGIVTSAEFAWVANEFADSLRRQGLALAHVTVAGDEQLIRPLEAVLGRVDVLLAVPDSQVFNRNTAQSLFLTSYRYRVPVQGYSASLTRAGALLSLHSSPQQIGRQTAESLLSALRNPAVRLSPPSHPAYYSVSVNEQVARSLGISLPSAVELALRLEGER